MCYRALRSSRSIRADVHGSPIGIRVLPRFGLQRLDIDAEVKVSTQLHAKKLEAVDHWYRCTSESGSKIELTRLTVIGDL